MSLPTAQELQTDHIGPAIGHVLIHLELPVEVLVRDIPDYKQALHELQELAEVFEHGFREPRKIHVQYLEKFVEQTHCIFFNNSIFSTMDEVTIAKVAEINHTQRGHTSMNPQTFVHDLRISTLHNTNGHQLMSTILHELCHMLLHLHIELERKKGREPNWNLIGASRHGYHWMRLAKAVETRAKEILHTKIDLGRHVSVAVEWQASEIRPNDDFYLEFFKGEIIDEGQRPQTVKDWVEGKCRGALRALNQ